MTISSSTSNQRIRSESRVSITLTQDSVEAPSVSDPNPECTKQEQGHEEKRGSGDWPQGVPSSSGSATRHADENEEVVITSIRATDPTAGLGRIPAGFYIAVHHSGLEWRTENKCLSVNDDVVQWDAPIPIPSDLSTTVCLEIYASFEIQPMLGNGEQLRMLSTTVEQLLNNSAKDAPFIFPDDRRYSTSVVLDPHCSTTEPLGPLEEAMNNGHSALSRYQKYGGKSDLEQFY
ncbi:hypothetical protein J3R83DRAFT_3244 [Lanmaoa asiatica]|nr:hypothetical protein J3R83DRAFT_3244 [Lanmaoa asiatica]